METSDLPTLVVVLLGVVALDSNPDLFHAMPARLGAPVRFDGWRESVTAQMHIQSGWVVVAHLVAQSRDRWLPRSKRCERRWQRAGLGRRHRTGACCLIEHTGAVERLRLSAAAEMRRAEAEHRQQI